jgi:hypothetical protein
MSEVRTTTKERFFSLDLLRGYFILVIICDHLSRYPSFFQFVTGKALLWVTAAEGFVIISGLLVGYIRGYKARELSMKATAFKLWWRALTLYMWAVIGSIIYTVILWYLPLVGGSPGSPIAQGDWLHLIIESVTLNYTHLWLHFLKLYAIFLAVTPLAIWLLRTGRTALVIWASLVVLILGWALQNEVMQWQAVFFVPAAVGYWLPTIRSWWRERVRAARSVMTLGITGFAATTIVMSCLGVFFPHAFPALDQLTLTYFAKDSMSLARLGAAFLWFTAFVFVFIRFESFIQRWFGWLLMQFGTRSLTAYIVHGMAIISVSFVFAVTDNVFINTIFDIIAIMIVWLILRIPNINRVVPR